LLSPSKIRRSIQLGASFDPAVLGALLLFLIENKINLHQWDLLKPYARRNKTMTPLFPGPRPFLPSQFFLKYKILANSYELNQSKFLTPIKQVYRNCAELKNRALFGSTVNADVASFLLREPNATPYQISKLTKNHKARVYEVFEDVRSAL
jgi:hypothetical protein